MDEGANPHIWIVSGLAEHRDGKSVASVTRSLVSRVKENVAIGASTDRILLKDME